MIKLIYDRYVSKGGNRTLDEFQNPHTGLMGLAYVDGMPKILFWNEELDAFGVIKPTTEELIDADSRV